MNNIETGKFGENMANKYLLNNGYLILARNHKEKSGEIDVIARHRNGTLIFCEVKTINTKIGFNSEVMPEDNLSPSKHRKMLRAGELFLAKHQDLINEERGWQFDLVAIVLRDGKVFKLTHYENI